MIIVDYSVFCDVCGKRIASFPTNPPTKRLLAEYGCEIMGTKLFCSLECKEKYKSDVKKRINGRKSNKGDSE